MDPLPDGLSVTFIADRRRYLVTFETLYYSLLTRREVHFENYDLIHGTLMPASPIAMSVRPPSAPLVLTSHGTSLGEVRSHQLEVPTDYLKKFFFHPMNVLMDAATIRHASRVIAISRDSQKELQGRYPVSDNAVRRVPHGVDCDRFRPDCAGHPDVSPDRFTLLHVGRLVSRKHVDLGLEALATLDRDDVELLVAGTGTHRDRLEQKTRDLGISHLVSFLGFVPEDDLPSLYASSDAFLFLSRYEGFGLVFLEALASGTPVIGSRVGGFPDLVTDGQEGLIVDRDASAVAGAIDTLAESPERAAQMGERARALAEGRTWDVVAEETEAVYEAALRGESPDSNKRA